jgi:hypothetical protein
MRTFEDQVADKCLLWPCLSVWVGMCVCRTIRELFTQGCKTATMPGTSATSAAMAVIRKKQRFFSYPKRYEIDP